MALRKIFCPHCGEQTQVNEDKAFSFCLFCGNKIVLHRKEEAQTSGQMFAGTEEIPEAKLNEKINEKLKEAAFYYQMSQEKEEACKLEEEPLFYLKAQDLLVDLSEEYPNDYRIWWELCKPVDFWCASMGYDLYGQYVINKDYFDRALEKATLSEKRTLIDAYDHYYEEKKLGEKKAEERRNAEEQKRLAEQQKQQEEELRKQQEEEARAQEKREKFQRINEQIWNALEQKDYEVIDNTWFSVSYAANNLVGIFKNVSGTMYLISLCVHADKNNMVSKEQSLVIKFDHQGQALTFDNRPVRITGMRQGEDLLEVRADSEGNLMIHGMPLRKDINFVTQIMKSAKKTLYSSTKLFI